MNLATIENHFYEFHMPKRRKELEIFKIRPDLLPHGKFKHKSKTKIEIGRHLSNSFLILIYLISEILEAQVLHDILLIFYKQLTKN